MSKKLLIIEDEETVKYTSEGVVYGNYWGGGKGSYAARKLVADTSEAILEQAVAGLDGSLDSGMGYESLIGALIDITKTTTKIIDNKPFVNEESEIEFVGILTEEEQDFLLDCYYQHYE